MVKNKVRKSIGIVIPAFNDWTSRDLLIGKLNQQAELAAFNLLYISSSLTTVRQKAALDGWVSKGGIAYTTIATT